jgi:hypothetical protein
MFSSAVPGILNTDALEFVVYLSGIESIIIMPSRMEHHSSRYAERERERERERTICA